MPTLLTTLKNLLNRLTPSQAIWLCFGLGYVGLFLPWGVVGVAPGSVAGAPPVLWLWNQQLPLDAVNNCLFANYIWPSSRPPADWLMRLSALLALGLRLLFIWPVMFYYARRFGKTTRALLSFFLLGLALALTPIFLTSWLSSYTTTLLCNPLPIVYLGSPWPFLPSWLVWVASEVLGLSALQRQRQAPT